MRFVDHHKVPRHALHCVRLASGELIGADDDLVRTLAIRTTPRRYCATPPRGAATVLGRPGDSCRGRRGVEGVRHAILDGLPERLCFKDRGGQAELVGQFLMPLLAQIGRRNDEDAAPALGPTLGNQQAGFDSLAQAHLVGQDRALGERVAGGKQRRVDLMGVQVDLRIQQRAGHPVHRVVGRPQGELVREVRELVRAVVHIHLFTAAHTRRRARCRVD
jgi:hypothetical protein